MTNFAIELNGISKSFGPVQANKDIDLAVETYAISLTRPESAA